MCLGMGTTHAGIRQAQESHNMVIRYDRSGIENEKICINVPYAVCVAAVAEPSL